VRQRLPTAAQGIQRSDRPVRRGAGLVLLPDRPDRLDGEAFAPGFYVWNSEVGSRTIGIETFWFQRICGNHIAWDAVEVVEFSRKHTTNVREALDEVRRIIESLVAKRDARRDGFAKVMRQAIRTKLGGDAEEVEKLLSQQGIPKTLAKEALEFASSQGQGQGGFTVFSVVDALTRLSRRLVNAGDRTELDKRFGKLLALAL
jgi:hypothetical protein